MGWQDVPLHEDYAGLAKQFRALRVITASFESQLRTYQHGAHAERKARDSLDSERAANAMLTDEVERLNVLVSQLQARLQERERPAEGA
jgi:hypothetical protein